MQYITGSKLYDYIQCPHRVWRDVHGPQNEKIQETNPFVELLWNKGVQHEERIISKIGEFVDVREGTLQERFVKTLKALQEGKPLIYQGVLFWENLKGIPDLLRKNPDGTYVPIEIKSGMGFEGTESEEGDEENGRPKKSYAVQLALYVELLQKMGYAAERRAAVIDISKSEVEYVLDAPMGKRTKQTFWDFYEETKEKVGNLLGDKVRNKPAMAGACKLCPWYGSCKKWCKENEDLTNIFYLGRSKRDMLNEDLAVFKVGQIGELDMHEILQRKKKDKQFLKGIGESTLSKIIIRTDMIAKGKPPVLYKKLDLPKVSYELFFDIEDDPTQEFVYLHGVYERSASGERFLDFTATDATREEEQDAWQRFWDYIRSLPKDDFAVYYYSHHEKKTYFKMQKKYPGVVSVEELTAFFENCAVIDLYSDVVLKHTDWPLGSYSIKEIAQYLGFRWRDETPSGALSIQWFNAYLESKDAKILERILQYNEDDCKATMVLKDALDAMDRLRASADASQ